VCTPSAGATRTVAAASSTRCATPGPITSSPPTGSARSRRRRSHRCCDERAGAAVNEGLRTPGGGRIDRSRALRFSFDGRAYSGFAGDTLASALLASGVHLMGRSFKYHRPRGALAAGAEEPNALVAVRRDAARYAARYAHCDVLVVGGGPAGLASATAAASAGARVILCDEQNELGGSLLADAPGAGLGVDGRPAGQWLAETVAALTSNTRVTLLI